MRTITSPAPAASVRRTAAVVTALTTALVVMSPPTAAEAASRADNAAQVGSPPRAESSDVDAPADPTPPPTTAAPDAEDPEARESDGDGSLVWWILGAMVVVLGIIVADPLLARRRKRD